MTSVRKQFLLNRRHYLRNRQTKVPYPTEACAVDAARVMARRYGTPFDVYSCSDGSNAEHWHVGQDREKSRAARDRLWHTFFVELDSRVISCLGAENRGSGPHRIGVLVSRGRRARSGRAPIKPEWGPTKRRAQRQTVDA